MRGSVSLHKMAKRLHSPSKIASLAIAPHNIIARYKPVNNGKEEALTEENFLAANYGIEVGDITIFDGGKDVVNPIRPSWPLTRIPSRNPRRLSDWYMYYSDADFPIGQVYESHRDVYMSPDGWVTVPFSVSQAPDLIIPMRAYMQNVPITYDNLRLGVIFYSGGTCLGLWSGVRAFDDHYGIVSNTCSFRIDTTGLYDVTAYAIFTAGDMHDIGQGGRPGDPDLWATGPSIAQQHGMIVPVPATETILTIRKRDWKYYYDELICSAHNMPQSGSGQNRYKVAWYLSCSTAHNAFSLSGTIRLTGDHDIDLTATVSSAAFYPDSSAGGAAGEFVVPALVWNEIEGGSMNYTISFSGYVVGDTDTKSNASGIVRDTRFA